MVEELMIDQVGQCKDMIETWLLMIWDSVFKVPLLQGPGYSITGASLLAGVLGICVAIWIFHYFRDNTRPVSGGKSR